MRTLFYTLSIFLSFSVFGQQNEDKIPESAQRDFESRINTTDKSNSTFVWGTIPNGLKVTYSTQNESGILFYDEEGNFKASWTEVTFESMKDETKNYVLSNFSRKKIQNAYVLSSATAPERNVVIVKEKGKLIELYFRPDGQFHYQQ